MYLIILYNLFLFITVRDILYLIYVGHLISSTMAVLYINNYPPFSFLSFIPYYIWHTHQYVWFALNSLFAALFVTYFLDLRKNAPILFYFLYLILEINYIYSFIVLL